MDLHPRPDYFSYWSMDPLFSPEFIKCVPISRNCFSAILTFLPISDIDPTTIDYSDRLQKVRNLLDYLNSKCKDHFYPHQNVSLDERMVKNKGRFPCK